MTRPRLLTRSGLFFVVLVVALAVSAVRRVSQAASARHLARVAGSVAARLVTSQATPVQDEGVVVGSLVEGVSRTLGSDPAASLAVVLDRPPGDGGPTTFMIYRLRTLLYPRTVQFLFPSGGRLDRVDHDYRRQVPAPAFARLEDALAGVDWLVVVGGWLPPPPGFERATPAAAFGYGLYRRARISDQARAGGG